jgi:hypothetical protein
VPKKILALYYFEKAPLSQIAACFGLPESEITRIRAKTVAALRKEFYGTLSSEERRTALRERICSSLLPF